MFPKEYSTSDALTHDNLKKHECLLERIAKSKGTTLKREDEPHFQNEFECRLSDWLIYCYSELSSIIANVIAVGTR